MLFKNIFISVPYYYRNYYEFKTRSGKHYKFKCNKFQNKFISDYLELVCLPNKNNDEGSTAEISTIGNFQYTESVLNFFESHSIVSILKDSNKVFLIKLLIGDITYNLNPNDLDKLSRRYANNSMVIFLATEKEQKFFLYWKSNKIQHFLMFKIYNRFDYMNDLRIFEFIANFLAKSLRYGHLGKVFFYFH